MLYFMPTCTIQNQFIINGCYVFLKQTDIYLNLGKHISGGPHVCFYGYNCDVTYRIIEVEFFQYDAKSAIFQKFSDMVTVATCKQHN